MTVLVFGQTGQVAQALRRRLPEARYLGRAEADLSAPGACAAALRAARPTVVINGAAWPAVDRAAGEEAAATVVNAEAPGAMARACADLGIPFLHVSTDYVFDGQGERPFAPDDPTGPLGAYGRSKLQGERAVRDSGAAHLILRTSWVFSADGANFVKTMLRLGRERDRLTVVADQIGGPTPADGIAAALVTCAGALRDGAKGGTYHYAGAPDVSSADFARAIMAEAGLAARVEDIPTSAYPTPAARPLNSRLDCSALETAFGIARPDWRAALRDVVRELSA